MIRLEHVALWTRDVGRLRAFYERYLDARAGGTYHSERREGFTSIFLTFSGGGRLELMSLPEIGDAAPAPAAGFAHIAVGLESRVSVDVLCARMAADGVRVTSGPRQTGDGYYEAVVLDPDGNEVEITG
jgi:lactoylglutathione lyase